MKRISVMLVDDNPKFLKIASFLFKDHDEVDLVSLVNGGQDAVEKAKALDPDIVVVDLAMPGVPGLELISRFRQELPEIGIIALTFHDTETYRHAAITAGADSFVGKASMHNVLIPEISKIRAGRVSHLPAVG